MSLLALALAVAVTALERALAAAVAVATVLGVPLLPRTLSIWFITTSLTWLASWLIHCVGDDIPGGAVAVELIAAVLL